MLTSAATRLLSLRGPTLSGFSSLSHGFGSRFISLGGPDSEGGRLDSPPEASGHLGYLSIDTIIATKLKMYSRKWQFKGQFWANFGNSGAYSYEWAEKGESVEYCNTALLKCYCSTWGPEWLGAWGAVATAYRIWVRLSRELWPTFNGLLLAPCLALGCRMPGPFSFFIPGMGHLPGPSS